jgi:hypothetical protein
MEEIPEAQTVVESRVSDKTGGLPGYGTPLQRPEPMEHMLTEDGEPMLNPGPSTISSEILTSNSILSIAELLTQVSTSIAYPPFALFADTSLRNRWLLLLRHDMNSFAFFIIMLELTSSHSFIGHFWVLYGSSKHFGCL